MQDLQNHIEFQARFERLHTVTLNPRRHALPNAGVHSRAVSQTADALAELNGCTSEERSLLQDLGLAPQWLLREAEQRGLVSDLKLDAFDHV
ncbi:MAG: hypothetical protein KC776_41295 [Myxococcales bacterium]|nr:hypothetical protein [Myxococcales bacterium]MCB9577006.1 hypothetical protein [Polyangiaceae bacterium]